MQRDIKIGLLAGLIIAVIAMVYVCTRPSLSPTARILKTTQPQEKEQAEPEPQSHLQPAKQPSQPLPDLRKPVEPVRFIEPLPKPVAIKETELVITQEPQPQKPTYVSTEKIKTTRFYIVRKGDTLSKISKRYYGSANQWNKIYEANRDVLGNNPDFLRLGTKLIIPE